MNLWQHYVCPATLSEALLALRDAPAPATPIGGGTDLLIDLAQGRHSRNTLADLSSVREMTA
jgi:CO/xanthine dehydrogenase FAD-binding subunit